jgi:hypothetical protein
MKNLYKGIFLNAGDDQVGEILYISSFFLIHFSLLNKIYYLFISFKLMILFIHVYIDVEISSSF